MRLQKGFRYLRLKKQFAKYAEVILVMQRVVRGHLGRNKCRQKRIERARKQAVQTIQRIQRGRKSRERTAVLAEERRIFIADKEGEREK